MVKSKKQKTKKQTPNKKVYAAVIGSILGLLIVILLSFFSGMFHGIKQGLVFIVFVLGLWVSGLGPAYAIIPENTPRLIRILGVVAVAALFVFLGMIIWFAIAMGMYAF